MPLVYLTGEEIIDTIEEKKFILEQYIKNDFEKKEKWVKMKAVINGQIEKLQACLKGEESITNKEIKELLDRTQYEVLNEPSYNFEINKPLSEKLKGYLGE